MRVLANIVSYLFNPLLVTTAIFYLLAFVFPVIIIPIKTFGQLLLATLFVVSFLIPVVSLIAMRKMGVISDLMIADRTQRTIPLIYTSLVYFAAAMLIFQQERFNDYLVSELLLMVGSLMLVVAVITLFWKISAHTTGLGGVLGLLFRLVFIYYGIEYIYALCIVILITGIVMTARLYLGAHTYNQTIAGIVLGFVYAYGCSFLLI